MARTDDDEVGGLSGTASAFQRGASMARGKAKAPKSKKQAQGSQVQSPTVNATIPYQPMQGIKVPAYKDGGRVRKTGLALVHKGEYVVPAKHKKASRKRTVIK